MMDVGAIVLVLLIVGAVLVSLFRRPAAARPPGVAPWWAPAHVGWNHFWMVAAAAVMIPIIIFRIWPMVMPETEEEKKKAAVVAAATTAAAAAPPAPYNTVELLAPPVASKKLSDPTPGVAFTCEYPQPKNPALADSAINWVVGGTPTDATSTNTRDLRFTSNTGKDEVILVKIYSKRTLVGNLTDPCPNRTP